MDSNHHNRRAAKIAKKEQDKGRRRHGKKQKKRLHILFDPEIKAFQGWEAVVEPWSLATCERFIEWCHIGKAFPPSRHAIHRKHNVANLKYCTWPEFKERCIQVHQFLYDQANVKSNTIILSILRMVYAEVALLKKVNWMTMRSSSTTKMIIPTSPDIPQVRKYLEGGLGRMMDPAIVSDEEVNWSETSSDDDQTRCESEIRREKEGTIKSAWLTKHLLDMVEQDEVNSTKLHVDITMEVEGQDRLEILPHTEALEEEPHPNDNVEHNLEVEEELRRARATIEELKKRVGDLESELLVKDRLIRAMQVKH
jgi:hypothetical protein